MKRTPVQTSEIQNTKPAHTSTHRAFPARARWILPLALLGVVASCLALWSVAQTASPPPQPNVAPEKQRLGEPDEDPVKRQERELSRLAILEPADFERAVAKGKTQQEIQNEQIAVLSITQPKFYSGELEKFKSPERRQLEQNARAVILAPFKYYGAAQKKEKQSTATPPQNQSGRP